jgi:hypothetical protein
VVNSAAICYTITIGTGKGLCRLASRITTAAGPLVEQPMVNNPPLAVFKMVAFELTAHRAKKATVHNQ